MKRISHLLLLSIFLASCVNVATPAPTSIITFTSVPSSTPTAIPATPTATEDPLKNAPEGTTHVVNGVPLMDAKDGYTYMWDELLHSWVRYLIKDYFAYDRPSSNTIPIDVRIKLGTPGSEKIKALKHKDATSFEDKSFVPDELTKWLMERFNLSFENLTSQLESSDGIDFDFFFNNEPMTGNFGTDSGIQVTIVSAQELKELDAQHKAVSVQGIMGMIYYTIDGVNDEGTVLFRIAHELPLDKLLVNAPNGDREHEFRTLVVLPLANLLVPDADQFKVYNLTLGDILAARTGLDRQDGNPDLQILIGP